MRYCVFFVIATLIVGPLRAPAVEAIRPAAPALPEVIEPDDTVDILFLATRGPVLLRLHLRVEGRSYRSPWFEFCERMFRDLDWNADGILSHGELEKIPAPDVLVDGNSRGAPQGIESVRENIDMSSTDGIVTLQEFRDYLARQGAAALQVQAFGPATPETPGTAGPGDLLFGRLDVDGDGCLSAEEFTAAPRVLAPIDFDEDGTFSRMEFQPGWFNNPFVRAISPGRNVAAPAEFIELPATPRETIARRLLDQYDTGGPAAVDGTVAGTAGDERLEPCELAIPADRFAGFDANRDGVLDFEELQAIGVGCSGSIELIVRIGDLPAGAPAIEVHRLDATINARVSATTNGQITLQIPGSQLEFTAPAAGSASQSRDDFRQRFRMADRDNNNYLERSEVRNVFPFNQVFDSMDEDDDGKVYEREMLAYIDRREAAAGSRCLLSVVDEGRNLFEVLDVNRDGRLGPRELRAGSERLAIWDTDGNAKLSDQEIPAHYRLVFGRAPANIPGIPALANFRGSAAATPSDCNPDWFRRMDRNRDGDISPREFLGSPAVFDRLDTNRDGLIGETEARAAATDLGRPAPSKQGASAP